MIIEWSKYGKVGYGDDVPLIELDIHMTQHATDRADNRPGSVFKISKKTIESIIHSAEDKILELGRKFPTLILKTQNAINIVGHLAQRAGDWVFDVITVMVKPDFHPKNPMDKVVYVNEALPPPPAKPAAPARPAAVDKPAKPVQKKMQMKTPKGRTTYVQPSKVKSKVKQGYQQQGTMSFSPSTTPPGESKPAKSAKKPAKPVEFTEDRLIEYCQKLIREHANS